MLFYFDVRTQFWAMFAFIFTHLLCWQTPWNSALYRRSSRPSIYVKLKTWIIRVNGTHQGSVSPKYLSYYLDEFAFRFNRKLSTYRGKLFYRLMQQAVDTAPQPFKEITKSTWLKEIGSLNNLINSKSLHFSSLKVVVSYHFTYHFRSIHLYWSKIGLFV